MKKWALTGFAFILIIGLCGYLYQRVDEGYVAGAVGSEEELSLLVINLGPEEAEGKTRSELVALLDDKADQAGGTYYAVPWVNKQLGTTFEKGDRVKIFWTGTVMESKPGQVPGTNYIVNFRD